MTRDNLFFSASLQSVLLKWNIKLKSCSLNVHTFKFYIMNYIVLFNLFSYYVCCIFMYSFCLNKYISSLGKTMKKNNSCNCFFISCYKFSYFENVIWQNIKWNNWKCIIVIVPTPSFIHFGNKKLFCKWKCNKQLLS